MKAHAVSVSDSLCHGLNPSFFHHVKTSDGFFCASLEAARAIALLVPWLLCVGPSLASESRLARCDAFYDRVGSSMLLESRRLEGLGLNDFSEGTFDIRILELVEDTQRGESAISVRSSEDLALVHVVTASRNVRAANLTPSGKVRAQPRLPPTKRRTFSISRDEFEEFVEYLDRRLQEVGPRISSTRGRTIIMLRGTWYHTRCGSYEHGGEHDDLHELVRALIEHHELRLP